MFEAGIGLAVGLTALIPTIVLLTRELSRVRSDLEGSRDREADLLSRLMARTHGEYAAFASPFEQVPEVRLDGMSLYDPTGLIEVIVPRDDTPVG